MRPFAKYCEHLFLHGFVQCTGIGRSHGLAIAQRAYAMLHVTWAYTCTTDGSPHQPIHIDATNWTSSQQRITNARFSSVQYRR